MSFNQNKQPKFRRKVNWPVAFERSIFCSMHAVNSLSTKLVEKRASFKRMTAICLRAHVWRHRLVVTPAICLCVVYVPRWLTIFVSQSCSTYRRSYRRDDGTRRRCHKCASGDESIRQASQRTSDGTSPFRYARFLVRLLKAEGVLENAGTSFLPNVLYQSVIGLTKINPQNTQLVSRRSSL